MPKDSFSALDEAPLEAELVETAPAVTAAPARVLGVGAKGCISHPSLSAAEAENHTCEETV